MSACPILRRLAKKPALLEWQVFPSMQPNPEFVAALAGALADKETPLLFLCRSGVEVGRGGESHDRGRIQYMSST